MQGSVLRDRAIPTAESPDKRSPAARYDHTTLSMNICIKRTWLSYAIASATYSTGDIVHQWRHSASGDISGCILAET